MINSTDHLKKEGEVTNPLGEKEKILSFIGIQVYRTQKQVEKIEKYVRSTEAKKFAELVRAFSDLSPQEGVEKLMEAQERSTQLVKNTIEALKQETNINRYTSSAISEKTSSSIANLPNISQVNVNGTIMLFNLFIRKAIGEKHISSADKSKSLSLLEAQGYALSITEDFEKLVKRTARSCGIQDKNFNPLVIQSAIVGQLMSDTFSGISKTLYSAAKNAYPKFKQTDKFLSCLRDNLEEMLVYNSTAKEEIEISKKPDTLLNGTSIQSVGNVLDL